MPNLTAPLIDRDLTAPPFDAGGILTDVIHDPDTRVTRGGNRRVTRGGNVRIARNVTEDVYLKTLTAPLIDRDLTAPERDE